MSYNFKEVLNTYIIFRITVRNFSKPYLLVVAALEAVLALVSTFFFNLKSRQPVPNENKIGPIKLLPAKIHAYLQTYFLFEIKILTSNNATWTPC